MEWRGFINLPHQLNPKVFQPMDNLLEDADLSSVEDQIDGDIDNRVKGPPPLGDLQGEEHLSAKRTQGP